MLINGTGPEKRDACFKSPSQGMSSFEQRHRLKFLSCQP